MATAVDTFTSACAEQLLHVWDHIEAVHNALPVDEKDEVANYDTLKTGIRFLNDKMWEDYEYVLSEFERHPDVLRQELEEIAAGTVPEA